MNQPPEPEDRQIAALHPGLSRDEVFRALYTAVEYVIGTGVDGHLAEFGTMSGDTACVLAKALGTFGAQWRAADIAHRIGPRNLLLFDSFQGLPAADNEIDASSLHVARGVWSAGTCRGIGPDALARRCSRYLAPERIAIHAGWFADTVPALPDDLRFALLHIDSDLYESARDVLHSLFERRMMSDGAMILFDDWNCNRASPRFGERRAFAETIKRFGLNVTDCGHYGFVSRRFIVHF
jgi:hypothetical protein